MRSDPSKLTNQGYGTALGVITASFEEGQLDRAFYAQTAPYHQGGSTIVSIADIRFSADFARVDDASNTQHHDL